MQVDLISQLVQHYSNPSVDPGFSASNKKDIRVNQTHRMRPLPCLRCVRLRRLLSDLPLTPDFISQTRILDAVRFIVASVLVAQDCVVAAAAQCE